uniref:Phosphatase and actin regulator 4 n=1 Tax=Cyclopterus lumpus TaxID=8103 RepID=A0A8C2XK74_CYCLU
SASPCQSTLSPREVTAKDNNHNEHGPLYEGGSTPPPKRKGKFSTLGKIFKPWKWRKKKSSDSFNEASEELERKMSTRRTRQELIEQGVLKDVPDNGESTFVTHLISLHSEKSNRSSSEKQKPADI